MPYIRQEDRVYLDDSITRLVFDMKEIYGLTPVSPGIVNYVVTRIALKSSDTGKWSYASISSVIRILEDAAKEMRRRLLDPYEDKAIAKNGDIPEYESFS